MFKKYITIGFLSAFLAIPFNLSARPNISNDLTELMASAADIRDDAIKRRIKLRGSGDVEKSKKRILKNSVSNQTEQKNISKTTDEDKEIVRKATLEIETNNLSDILNKLNQLADFVAYLGLISGKGHLSTAAMTLSTLSNGNVNLLNIGSFHLYDPKQGIYVGPHGADKLQSDNGDLATVSVNAGSGSDEFPDVDFDLILQWEEGGKLRLNGYHPGSQFHGSGVTVSGGVDLGGKNTKFFQNLGIPSSTIDKLKPYFGLKGSAAINKLKKVPLKLTASEAKQLHTANLNWHVKTFAGRFDRNRAAGVPAFRELPSELQTAIGSMSYHKGAYFDKSRSATYRRVANHLFQGNWNAASRTLANKKDQRGIVNRNRREASLIRAGGAKL